MINIKIMLKNADNCTNECHKYMIKKFNNYHKKFSLNAIKCNVNKIKNSIFNFHKKMYF